MRRNAARSVACAVVVAAGLATGLAGCSFSVSGSSTPTRSGPSAPSTQAGSQSGSGSGPGSGAMSLDRVAAGTVDLIGVHSLDGTETAGTGIVLSADGEVLTNNHVISGSTSLTGVDVGNGRSYQAKVIGYDRSHDLALVQLQGASGLQTLAPAVGVRVSVGDKVTGLGNAGGVGGQPARAAGAVTALDQRIMASDEATGSSEQLNGLIQVDAPIESGDSGGPLVNASGQVIGIDTAASVGYRFQSSQSSAPTEGFAIPAAQARSTADAIAAGRASSTVHIGATAWLGVAVRSSDPAAGNGGGNGAGATVVEVVPGSPADRLGLAQGDVITSVDGAQVADATALTALLDGHHPGDGVTLGWTDSSGQSTSSTVQLGSGPAG